MNSNVDFTSLLETVTVDSKDDGERFQIYDRIEAIQSILEPTDYQLLKAGKLFFLYGKQPMAGEEYVLISSHIDCVYNRCHCADEGEFYKGTFDNSLTNAAVLYNMLKGRFHENVLIAFTGDEEKDSGGAIELINYFINQTSSLLKFVVVTDVTNEGWEAQAPFSIENDLGIDLFTAHYIVELLNPYLYSFVHHAEPDESWDYNSVHLPCLTLCVPVSGNLHDDSGVMVRKMGMPTYCQVLALLANHLVE